MAITSYTKELNPSQVEILKKTLERDHFEFSTRPYSHYSAKKGKLNVTVYEKGPKVLIQGKETEDFVRFTLEPKVLKNAELGYEEVQHPEWFEPHFGIDESGKGDALGPLTVGGVYTNKSLTNQLIELGVMDSKAIKSREKIAKLAKKIKALPELQWDVLIIEPLKYNELYAKFHNLNTFLAWGHATVISNLLIKQPNCPTALSDQFANPRVLQNALNQKQVSINLKQRVRAESDPAVAAASILARNSFVSWMEDHSSEFNESIPLGSGNITNNFIKRKINQNNFAKYGKIHFKNFCNIKTKDTKID